jgi:hypothetical protein
MKLDFDEVRINLYKFNKQKMVREVIDGFKLKIRSLKESLLYVNVYNKDTVS